MKRHLDRGWATCPLIENGFLRIYSQPNYPNGPGSVEVVVGLLRRLCSQPRHQFWPDDISLADNLCFPSLRGSTPSMLTDLYLLRLAIHHGGQFATFDGRINPELLPGGKRAYLIVT